MISLQKSNSKNIFLYLVGIFLYLVELDAYLEGWIDVSWI